MQANVNPVVVDLLVGHDIGIKGNYYRPSNEDLMEAYLQGIDALTINEENKLKRKLVELKTENDVLRNYGKQLEEIKASWG